MLRLTPPAMSLTRRRAVAPLTREHVTHDRVLDELRWRLREVRIERDGKSCDVCDASGLKRVRYSWIVHPDDGGLGSDLGPGSEGTGLTFQVDQPGGQVTTSRTPISHCTRFRGQVRTPHQPRSREQLCAD